MSEDGGTFDINPFYVLVGIICILGIVAGGTVGKWAKIGCEIGKFFGFCSGVAPTSPMGPPPMGPPPMGPRDGYFLIRVRHSGKCLDVGDASQVNSVSANQFQCHGGPNQQWSLVEVG